MKPKNPLRKISKKKEKLLKEGVIKRVGLKFITYPEHSLSIFRDKVVTGFGTKKEKIYKIPKATKKVGLSSKETGRLNKRVYLGNKIIDFHTKKTIEYKKVKAIKKVSTKRAKELREYSKLRKKYLEEHPLCRPCMRESAIGYDGEILLQCTQFVQYATDIHHIEGREGSLLNKIESWLPVCRQHHMQIHNNPKWAIENGYILKDSK